MTKDLRSDEILHFEQGAEFLLRMGRKHIERNDLVRALHYIRKAYRKQPQNADTVMALGEVLNRMQRFEESTRVLLLFAQSQSLPGDGLFGLASNFMAMEEFGAAEYCLNKYLQDDPDGVYAGDAEDYLSIITDTDELTYQLGLDSDDELELLVQLHYVDSLHHCHRDEDALMYAEQLKQRYPGSKSVELQLAVLQFCLKSYDKCEQGLFNLLKQDKNNVRARCLLALLYRNQGKTEQASDMLRGVKISVNASTEELSNAALTFLDFGLLDRGRQALDQLRRMVPYDEQVLHQIGYCHMAKGEKEEAEKIYLLLLRLNEDDTIAQYYLSRVREGTKEEMQNDWMIVYSVPYMETFRRLQQLKEVLEADDAVMRDTWRNDASFRRLMRWALFDASTGNKELLAAALQLFGDEYAREMMFEFLLLPNQSDKDKQAIIASLRAMQVDLPRIMFYNGAWQQGKFRPITMPEHVPVSYEMVLQFIHSVGDKQEYPEQVVELAYKTCVYYISKFDGVYPRISQEQERALSAAFMLLALQTTNHDVKTEDIMEAFGVSERRLMNALRRVFRHLEGE